MTVTFADARRIVADALRDAWTAADGTLTTLDYGWEDARYWRVIAGAREWLVDRDPLYMRMDAPAYLVDKTTSELVLLHVMSNFDRLEAMTPVGEHPAVADSR